MFCLLLLLLNISIQIWIERERLKIMRMLIEILQKKKMKRMMKNFILDNKISQNLLIKGQDDLKKSLKNKKIKINFNNIKEIFKFINNIFK